MISLSVVLLHLQEREREIEGREKALTREPPLRQRETFLLAICVSARCISQIFLSLVRITTTVQEVMMSALFFCEKSIQCKVEGRGVRLKSAFLSHLLAASRCL